jgi:hypothetical protein
MILPTHAHARLQLFYLTQEGTNAFFRKLAELSVAEQENRRLPGSYPISCMRLFDCVATISNTLTTI